MADVPSISGSIIHQGRVALTELVGKAALDAALATLPRADADIYRDASGIGWVPITIVESVIRAVAAPLGKDWLALNDEVTKVSVHRSFHTIWRVFFRFTTDEALLSRSPVVFSRTYNRGRISAQFPRPGRVEVALVEWPGASEFVLRSFTIGMAELLRIAGRGEPRITFTRTTDGATFVGSWRV